MNTAVSASSARLRVFAIFVIFASIQGGIIISQALTTLYLKQGDVGIIRAVESTIALIVLFASVGAPALAIRSAAIEEDPYIAGRRLRQLLVLSGAVGACLWAIVAAVQAAFVHGAIPRLIAELAGVAVFTNFVRICGAHIQGSSTAIRFALRIAILCTLSITIQTATTLAFGVNGWIAGRYAGEATVCLGIAVAVRRQLFSSSGATYKKARYFDLLRDGLWVNFALFIRLTADNLPMLGLTAAKLPTPELGHFGVAQLLMMIPTLAFAVLTQSAYPSIVQLRAETVHRRFLMLRLARHLLFVSAVTFMVLEIAIHTLRWMLPPLYIAAVNLALILVFALPLRGIALVVGSYFMASERYRLAVSIGIIEATVGGAAIIPVAERYGTVGAAWLSVLMAAVCVAAHLLTYYFIHRKAVSVAAAH